MPRRRRVARALLAACVTVVASLGGGCLPPPPASLDAPDDGGSGDAPRRLRAATDVARVYHVGEVRQFDMHQAGQSIGTSWGRYLGVDAAGNHRFETRIELRITGRSPARSAGELVLDPKGRLVRGFERSDAAELRYERRGDVLVITDGERVDEIAYEPDRIDTAFMAHSAILHAELMFALRDLGTEPMAWRLLSLSGGAPIEWTGRVAESIDGGDRLRIETGLGESIVFAGGRIESLAVGANDLGILASTEPVWPTFDVAAPRELTWRLPEHAHFTVRALELPGKPDEPMLAGEVLLPDAKAPVPGVLFLSATGQEDRYGFAGPPPVDLGSHELTDALAEAGFAVLRYDERGRGASATGDIGFLSQVSDARRALATLSIQPEVDPDRIIVIGHGEGGLRAMVLAAERAGDVHAVALLASPGRPYEQVLRAQAALRLEELPPDVREQARTQQRQMLDDLVKGRKIPPELEPQARWLREIFAVRPAELIARLRVEVLLAQGGKDFEVDAIADVEPLVRAAKRSRVKLEVRRYDELDHLFKPEPGLSAPERYREDRRVDAAFISDVIAWARRVTAARR